MSGISKAMVDTSRRVSAILLGAAVLAVLLMVSAVLTIYGVASVTLRRVSGHSH